VEPVVVPDPVFVVEPAAVVAPVIVVEPVIAGAVFVGAVGSLDAAEVGDWVELAFVGSLPPVASAAQAARLIRPSPNSVVKMRDPVDEMLM